jgi:hypothetical protein
VFLNSPHRETPKNLIKQIREKIGFGFLVEFFVKTFRHEFFVKRFWSAFELPSLRNTRKRDKTKQIEEKLTSKFFVEILGKVFDMDFLQKYFYGVFELPLPRNAQKRTKKKSPQKKVGGVGGWVWDLVKVRGGLSKMFFGGPSAETRIIWCASWRPSAPVWWHWAPLCTALRLPLGPYTPRTKWKSPVHQVSKSRLPAIPVPIETQENDTGSDPGHPHGAIGHASGRGV